MWRRIRLALSRHHGCTLPFPSICFRQSYETQVISSVLCCWKNNVPHSVFEFLQGSSPKALTKIKTFEINQMNLSRLRGTKYQISLQNTIETDESYLRVDSRISDLFRKSLGSTVAGVHHHGPDLGCGLECGDECVDHHPDQGGRKNNREKYVIFCRKKYFLGKVKYFLMGTTARSNGRSATP